MNELILYLGLAVFFIGGIGFLIAAFRTSAIVYLIVHWQDAKGPFKIQVIGFVIMLIAAYMNGGFSSAYL